MATIADYRKNLNDELGDALFYLTAVAISNGSSLVDIMVLQKARLIEQGSEYKRPFLK